jgi:membrane dipeptidase
MWCPCLGAFVDALQQYLTLVQPPMLERRRMLAGMTATAALAAAGCAPAATPAQRQSAMTLLDEAVSIDLHSHPGLVPSMARATMDGHIERLSKGHVRAALFSAVADGPVLTVSPQGRIYARREPAPGELYQSTYRQLEAVRTRAAAGKLALVTRIADLERARAEQRPAAVLAAEGGDFLEGRLERVEEAYDQGLRSIQLVHYRVNELGDIQTESPRHNGLTAFGRSVVREMNRLGMLVDVAHATFDTVKAVVETSSKPMVLSHTVVDVVGLARAVSREHARLVSERGGVVGVFPVAFGGPGFSGYIDHLSRMADAVGIDHVAIGTDMDGIPFRTATFDDYAEWPSISAALLARGYGRDDVAKVVGGNVVRVLRATIAA